MPHDAACKNILTRTAIAAAGPSCRPAGSCYRNDAVVEDCGLPDLQVPDGAANQCAGFALRHAAIPVGQSLLRSRQRTE